jgi:hypothetical protein
MQTVNVQECPRCGGAIDIENHAIEPGDAYETHLIYCTFCSLGVEAFVCTDGRLFPVQYERRYEPTLFDDFLKRLEGARAA